MKVYHSLEKYQEFCQENREELPVFFEVGWLRAVTNDSFLPLVLEFDGKIRAIMPIYQVKKLFFELILNPKFTNRLGIYLAYPQDYDYAKRLSFENKVYQKFIENLGKYSYLDLKFSYQTQNWLSFYWQKFSQETHYSYQLDLSLGIEKIYNSFSKSKQRDIKKAEKLGLKIEYDLDPRTFYDHHLKSLAKEGKKISYDYQLFKEMYDYAYQEQRGRVIYAGDKDGKIHSAIFVVYDSRIVYDLISTIDPDFRNSASATLLIFQLIKDFVKTHQIFDFEGSMIKGVEHSFRNFGAKQIPYFRISKPNSIFFHLFWLLRKLKNG